MNKYYDISNLFDMNGEPITIHFENKHIKEINKILNNISSKYEDYYVQDIVSNDDLKLLLSYIEQLEKKIDQYENPDDLTLFYMWLDTKAKDKMKQLEKRNQSLLDDRKQLLNLVKQLENNRDKAIEYVNQTVFNEKGYINFCYELINILKGDSDD